MRFYTARQVIHDAFMPDVTAIDVSSMILEFGVQHSARGAINKIMDHCEKGIIQQALEVQRHTDALGWAWNMFAYTPPGTGHGFERSTLLDWMAKTHKARGCAYTDPRLMMLARVAMQDVAHEDRSGKRRRRRYADLGAIISVDAEDYKRNYHKHYISFRGYVQTLPERSLPPIAAVVWCMIDKATGEPDVSCQATERLSALLKMPVGAV